MGIWYATREQFKAATGIQATARSNARIARWLESGSRSVEKQLHRVFYPEIRTQTFDWPNRSYARPWRLWLNQHELISADTVTAGGVEIDADDYFLRPDHGPPFTHVEIDLSSSASFTTGGTHQRAISILGLYAGAEVDEDPAGALEAAIADTTTTTVDVTDSSQVGVGTLLRCESERMLVTEKTMLDTGQTLQNSPTARADSTTVEVTDGTDYHLDEIILLDSEKMLVVVIAGNNLTVERAVDGTVLAAHSAGATIYAPRRLTVTRGALGTTAATHDDETALVRWVPPGLVTDLSIAEAIVRNQQEIAAYARTIGSGDNQREASGRGLADLRRDAKTAHGRQLRKRAI